jgi:NAD(P)-dependent dehydrogenase (short-subunit alcohol dehydrogenase family)
MNNTNPIAVVTGVGPGTGASLVRRFSQGGYAVAMVARNRERLDLLEREIANSHAYPCDVTDEAQLDSAIEAIRTDLGTPTILIHKRSAVRSGISWKSIPRC